jgi:hypothetical protein
MERIGSIAARVLADLRAANDNKEGAGASPRPSPRLEVAGCGSNPSGKEYPVGNADIAAAPSREDGCRVRRATPPARVGGGSEKPPRVEEKEASAGAPASDRRGCGVGKCDGGR